MSEKNRSSGFISVPNAQYLCGLPAPTQSLFIWMYYYTGTNGLCLLPSRMLAEDAGINRFMISYHLDKLLKLGLIERRGDDGDTYAVLTLSL